MKYADLTINDRNFIKRWLQRKRLADALQVFKQGAASSLTVLDFGAGDGGFVQLAHRHVNASFCIYEPTPALMAEARQNLSGVPGITFAEMVDDLPSAAFDYIFSLEVFEHLPEAESKLALDHIERLLKPSGLALIGVPHEIYLPALLKGAFRMTRRLGEYDARAWNIACATLGRPRADRPIGEISSGLRYYYHHLGFDYRCLQHALAERFRLRKVWYSPVPWLGAMLNSEVYFLLEKLP